MVSGSLNPRPLVQQVIFGGFFRQEDFCRGRQFNFDASDKSRKSRSHALESAEKPNAKTLTTARPLAATKWKGMPG